MNITAHVAGTVVSVVAPGTAVDAGTEVAAIECMKLEIPVESPVAGVVAEICVAVGDSVAEGALLARLDRA